MTSKFPHDRIVFFSDAVFAIAITLLIIEIKVPGHDTIHELGMGKALKNLIPLFIGYVVSFLVTALFWKGHLQLCAHVKEFNSRLIWLNILLLLFVALMPFSTALYSEYFGSNAAFSFYSLNLAAIGFMNYLMTRYVIRHQKLRDTFTGKEIKWMITRSLFVPVIFLLCIGIAQLSPLTGRVAFVLIFIVHLTGDRIVRKSKQHAALPETE